MLRTGSSFGARPNNLGSDPIIGIFGREGGVAISTFHFGLATYLV